MSNIYAEPHHYVTLTDEQTGRSVRALRGESAPRITGGYGGWEQTSRPGRAALVTWKGVPPFRLSLPLIFDGILLSGGGYASVDDDCQRLELMARPPAAFHSPPVLTISGAVPRRSLKWVVDTDGLDWGDAVYHPDGYRVRQPVTVSLIQRVLGDELETLSAAEQTRQQDAGSLLTGPRIYLSVEGDTLQKIAAHIYGDYTQASILSTANDIRDVRKELDVGTRIRLP